MGRGDITGKLSKSKPKGAVISFDEEARKSFLTGFRKRKNDRRQYARQKIAEQVRQEKLSARQERRTMQKQALASAVSEDEEDGGGSLWDADLRFYPALRPERKSDMITNRPWGNTAGRYDAAKLYPDTDWVRVDVAPLAGSKQRRLTPLARPIDLSTTVKEPRYCVDVASFARFVHNAAVAREDNFLPQGSLGSLKRCARCQ